MSLTFSSHVRRAPGMKATGVPIPAEIVEKLGDSKKPAVWVTIGELKYRTTVASRFGGYIVPLSAERREAAGLVADHPVEVTIELDLLPNTADLPADLSLALDAGGRREAFDRLSNSRQRAYVAQIDAAKTPETRLRRIDAAVASLTPLD